MRPLRPLLAVALGLAALASSAPAALAAFPGSPGRIAFERPGRGIWDVNPDGTGLRPLSSNPCDAHPAYSPDGSTIAFDSCAAGGIAIQLMNADGSNRRPFAFTAGGRPLDQQPAFDPTGASLVFGSGRFKASVLTEPLAGGAAVRVAQIGYDPSWSALGQIAFTVPWRNAEWCNSTSLEDIWVARADGRRARRLTLTYASYNPDWSPDGTRLAFTRDTTVSSRDLTRLHGIPDCKRSAAAAASRFGPQVFVVRADGTHMRQLTRSGGGAPAWSPDGAQIAFERRPWIYVMNADGSGVQRVAKGADPTWQPLPSG